MKIHAVMVTRNEADRYLQAVLHQLAAITNDIFIYDDRSTDETVDVAMEAGAVLSVRDRHDQSFMKHEGRFRQAAWNRFERVVGPADGDWVLSMDADEFLVASDEAGDVQKKLADVALVGAHAAAGGVLLPIHEVFEVDHGRPFIRTDGFWKSITAPRLFPYRPNGVFADRAMGCGSTPTYVTAGPLVPSEVHDVGLLHYGYAIREDQEAKWERYSGMQNHGHNPAHIDSILTRPSLEPWEGSLPLEHSKHLI